MQASSLLALAGLLLTVPACYHDTFEQQAAPTVTTSVLVGGNVPVAALYEATLLRAPHVDAAFCRVRWRESAGL